MVVKIIIKELTGKRTVIELDDDEFNSTAVDHVKCRIENRSGIPVSEQRLIFAGHQLEDARLICECGIQHESIIHLVINLRGGWLPEDQGGLGRGDKDGKNRSMEELADF